jgi:hypothetical protein
MGAELRALWEPAVKEFDAALRVAADANARVAEIRQQAEILLGGKSDLTIPPVAWRELMPPTQAQPGRFHTWRRFVRDEAGVDL